MWRNWIIVTSNIRFVWMPFPSCFPDSIFHPAIIAIYRNKELVLYILYTYFIRLRQTSGKRMERSTILSLYTLFLFVNGLHASSSPQVAPVDLDHTNNFGILCDPTLPNPNEVCMVPEYNVTFTFLECLKELNTGDSRCLCPRQYELSNTTEVTTALEWSVYLKKCVIKDNSPCVLEGDVTENDPECYSGKANCVSKEDAPWGRCINAGLSIIPTNLLILATIILTSLTICKKW